MTPRLAACSCGQLTATVSAAPRRVSVCHCLDCQRRTGGPFAAQARFPADSVHIGGASTAYVRVGGEGCRTTFHFCPHCSTIVYYQREDDADTIIPIGAFADPGFPAPTRSVGRRTSTLGCPCAATSSTWRSPKAPRHLTTRSCERRLAVRTVPSSMLDFAGGRP